MKDIGKAVGAVIKAVAMGVECLLWGGVDLTRWILSPRYIGAVIRLAVIAALTPFVTILIGFWTESQAWFLFGAIAFIFWATLFFVAALPALIFAGSVKAAVGIIFNKKTPAVSAPAKKK